MPRKSKRARVNSDVRQEQNKAKLRSRTEHLHNQTEVKCNTDVGKSPPETDYCSSCRLLRADEPDQFQKYTSKSAHNVHRRQKQNKTMLLLSTEDKDVGNVKTTEHLAIKTTENLGMDTKQSLCLETTEPSDVTVQCTQSGKEHTQNCVSETTAHKTKGKTEILKNTGDAERRSVPARLHVRARDRFSQLICGSRHQGDKRFSGESAGRQCSCNALMMLAFQQTRQVLRSNDVDDILDEGDQLYRSVTQTLHSTGNLPANGYLSTEDLPKDFSVGVYTYNAEYAAESIYGRLSGTTGAFEPLDVVIQQALTFSDSNILVLGNYMMALFRDHTGRYGIFDSHSRNHAGLADPNGSAIIAYFSHPEQLISYLYLLATSLNLEGSTFVEICPLTIRCQMITLSSANVKQFEKDQQYIELQHSKSLQTTQQDSHPPKEYNRTSYWQEYKRKRRQSFEFRVEERCKERDAKQTARKDDTFRKKERAQLLAATREARKDDLFRKKERAQQLEAKREARKDELFRKKECAQLLQAKREARKDELFRQKENAQLLQAKREARKDELFRQKERTQLLQAKREARKDELFRKTERAKEVQAKQTSRKDEMFKTKEREAKQALRENHVYRQQELAREVASKKRKRNSELYREHERMSKKQKRLDQRRSSAERIANTQTRSRKRQDPVNRLHEQVAKKKRTTGKTYLDCKNKFYSALIDGPIYVCTSCHQTWFRHSVVQVENINLSDARDILQRCRTLFKSAHGKEWICRTCLSAIRLGKIPRLSTTNKCSFPPKPEQLNLHQLEERLLSPRIPFMQLRELPRGGQLSIKGNVVNVPVDVAPTVTALPRHMSATDTIPVKLKRKLSYKTSAFTENVRPHKVIAGLRWLLQNGPVFQNAQINIDESWLDCFENTECDAKCVTHEEQSSSDHVENTGIHEDECESDHFSEVDDNENPAGNMDTMIDDAEYDATQVLEFAPGEGQRPLGLFQDPDAEYMAFPTIFCGQRRPENSERDVPVHYSEICKSELRHIDRRAAKSIPNMFFKLKKLQLQQIVNKVNLAVRRCKTKGRKFTARQALDQSVKDTMVKLDEGYHIFRTLRNSPPYLEKRKKDLMAMIRQLGCPTWFVSLSAADTRWTDLLRILGKLIDKKDYTDNELQEMDWETKTRLVRADPVTSARFFDNRLQLFLNGVLNNDLHPIGHIKDSFVRIEFQQRGSPHAHIMFWVEDAPNLDDNTPEEIALFVDKYVSCSGDVEDATAPLLEMQKHKHSKTCRKRQQPVCRYGFPKPPMRTTQLLEPLGTDDNPEAKTAYEKIKKVLSEHKDGMDVSHADFLQQLDLNEEDYIRAIRSSISHPTLFLKRQPSEIRINPYMKNLLGIYGANHDIQFITDPYACAVYIVAYMSKSQRGMSILMDRVCKEARQGNTDLRNQVRHIGKAFVNAVEVGAQEAAYLILQLAITRSTRSVIFINTSPADERTFLLKSKEKLEEMDPESTEIESSNILKRYSTRPKYLNRWCLADYVSKLTVTYPATYTDPYDTDHEDDPSNDSTDDDDDDDDDHEVAFHTPDQSPINITLNSGVKIKTCKKQKVIRFVNYSSKNDPENYAREKLMLYVPWRHEPQDILGEHESYSEHLLAKQEQIETKTNEYEPNRTITFEVLEEAFNREDDDDDIVAPGTQQAEADDALEGPKESAQYSFYQPDKAEHSQYDMSADVGMAPSIAQTPTVLANRVLDDDFRKDLASLNIKQREFFTHVMQWITTKDNPINVFLTGGAGVGKSVVIKTLYQALLRHLCSEEGENPEDCRIVLCAPTGKAAYNIQGCTNHSAFQIDPNQGFNYKRLSADRLNTLQVKYRHLSVVIMDEVSMVGNRQFLFIHQRLQEVKGNQRPFGGVHMIVVGDLYQLKPVMDQWIFMNLKHGYGPLSTNLWSEYFKMHQLTQIMRQKDDQSFAQLLNRLRQGNHTDQDIAKLKTRILDPCDLQYPHSVPHLFPTNMLVDVYNTKMFTICTNEKAVVKAVDCVVGDFRTAVKQRIISSVSKDPSKTAGLFHKLHVAVGMRYETVANISVEDGITNGSGCIVQKIQYMQSDNPIPSVLWVLFDEPRVGHQTRSKYRSYYQRDILKEWTPVFAIKRNFFAGQRHVPITRTQFPIRPAAAKTIHKSQGDTMDAVVVHMGIRTFAHSHYVALSRVRSMEGLRILELNEKNIKVTQSVKDEIKRLQSDACLELCYTPMYSVQPRPCKIVFQNARSLHKHFVDLSADHNIIAADIIAIAESRLTNTDTNSSYDIDGFVIHRMDQPQASRNRPPHGQVHYIANDCEVSLVHPYTTPLFEYCVIDVINLQLVTIYKSPTCSEASFREQMSTTLRTHIDIGAPLVILGDFNFDLFKNQKSFLTFMENTFHCKQHIDQATTISGSMLDLVFSNINSISCDVIYCAWSDHKTIHVVV